VLIIHGAVLKTRGAGMPISLRNKRDAAGETYIIGECFKLRLAGGAQKGA